MLCQYLVKAPEAIPSVISGMEVFSSFFFPLWNQHLQQDQMWLILTCVQPPPQNTALLFCVWWGSANLNVNNWIKSFPSVISAGFDWIPVLRGSTRVATTYEVGLESHEVPLTGSDTAVLITIWNTPEIFEFPQLSEALMNADGARSDPCRRRVTGSNLSSPQLLSLPLILVNMQM